MLRKIFWVSQEIHAEIKRKYQALTIGDKSCVTAAIQNTESAQLTTKESAHDDFYATLLKIGWARSIPVAPELDKLDSVTSWKLTSHGYENLPKLLHALEVEEVRDQYETQVIKQFSAIALKFITCYVCFYALITSIIYYSVKLGLPLEKITKELSLLTILCGFIVSATISLKNWGISKQQEYGLLPLAYYRFLESRAKLLALMYAALIIAISIGFEFYIYLSNTDQSFIVFDAKKLIGTVILGILIGAIGWSFLPQYISGKIRKILIQYSI